MAISTAELNWHEGWRSYQMRWFNPYWKKGVTFPARKNGEIMFHADEELNSSQLPDLPEFKENAQNILS